MNADATTQLKILIIKIGYSETLDAEIGRVPSLGDIVRTTPVLHAIRERFPTAHITWLVSAQAEPLIDGIPEIDRVLAWDEFVPFQLMRERFDILINLEKIPGVCALADMIDAWTRYGFRFDAVTGSYHAYERGQDFIDYIATKRESRDKGFWQQVLVEMLGVEWTGQEYIVGYRPTGETSFDVGFNHEVGSKWPDKAMPDSLWRDLEERLVTAGLSVTWQKGKTDLREYMDWIHSSRLVVTNDSLGLHLAMALRRKVVGLFGPTDPREVFFYRDGIAVTSRRACPKLPCHLPRCSTGLDCMGDIDIEDVAARIKSMLEAP